MQRRGQPKVSRYLLPGYVSGKLALPPLTITDKSILAQIDRSEWFTTEWRYGSWIGWPIVRETRRDASNVKHRAEVEAALASAVARGIIVVIRHHSAKMRYYGRPPPIPAEHVLVSDQIVDPPAPKLSPPSKPKRKRKPAKAAAKAKQLPAVVPNPVPAVAADTITLPAKVVRTLSRASPAAFLLYALLRLDYGSERNFNLIVFELAVRYNMAPQRITTAILALVRQGLIVDHHRENGHLDGTYGWFPRQITWSSHRGSKLGPGARRARREASHVEVHTCP
jgi:hypothetical protein